MRMRSWVKDTWPMISFEAAFIEGANLLVEGKFALTKSKLHRQYLSAAVHLTELIHEVLIKGSFEECLAVVRSTNIHELQHYCETTREQRTVHDLMVALEIGEVNYRTLRDTPEVYAKTVAAGFQKKNRLPPDRIIPKDGMHDALTSYEKHVHSRHSPLLAPEERELIRANARLAAGMLERYITMRKEALREPEQ